jgi:hypothetical protein
MRSILIFTGIYILSLVVAYAVACELAAYFFLQDEFIAVLFALALFSLLAIAVFAVLYVVQPNAKRLGYGAIGLAIVAFGVEQLPALADAFARRSTNPYMVGDAQDQALAASFLLPALIMLLVQWSLLRRRWLVAHRLEYRMLWPWFTIILACLLALNPLGLALIGSVIRQSSTDWLVGLWTTIVAIACGVLLVLALIEWWLRRRWLARRAADEGAKVLPSAGSESILQ